MNLRLKQRLDFYLGGALIFFLRPIVSTLGRLLRRDHSLEVAGEICILKLLGGGSLVLAYPALLGLRERHPDVRLSLICSRGVLPFAETLGIFDRLLVIDDSAPLRLVRSAATALARCFRADTVIDLEVYSRLSTAFSVFTMARNRLGFFLHEAFWRRGLHTHLIFFNRFSGSWCFYEKATALLDAAPADAGRCAEVLRRTLPDAPAERPRDRICLGVACSELAPERMLTPEQWEHVFRRRAAEMPPRTFVFLGAAADRELADAIVRRVRAAVPGHRYENLCGSLDLAGSLAELAGAAGYWGVDSGLLHYARLFGLPCVSWWGPTDPRTRLKPIAGLAEEVIYRKIPCSPCVHLAEAAPCGGNNVCLRNLFEAPSDGEPEWSPYVS